MLSVSQTSQLCSAVFSISHDNLLCTTTDIRYCYCMTTVYGLCDWNCTRQATPLYRQQSPIILLCHIYKVIPILSPVIFTSSLESVLVKFKEFFIYLFLYLSSVILKIHYSFRFNFRFFVKFYANIRTSDRVIAVKPNLKWRPPPPSIWSYFWCQFWLHYIFAVVAVYIRAEFHKCTCTVCRVQTLHFVKFFIQLKLRLHL